MGFASSILWLFISQACAGLFSATTATAGAYLADITPEEERAHRFGLTGAAFGTGIIIGPMLGGLLVAFGLRVPFFCAAVLALANVVYGAIVLPESLPPSRRRPFSWARSHVLGAIQALRPLPTVFPVLWATLLIRIALQTIPAIWPYFSMQQFGWTARDVGYSLGLYGIFSIIGQGFLVARLTRRFGPSSTVTCALVMAIVGFAGFAFAFNGTIALVCVVPSALGFMSGPAMTGLMSMHTPSSQQGELQGAIASLGSIAMMLTPPAMTGLYSHFASAGAVPYFPAAPYAAAALLSVSSLVAFTVSMKRQEPSI
jgi:DHA1 family tetracycline resistance protein-like MFS transporter